MHESSTKKVENVFSEEDIKASILYARILTGAFAVGAAMFAIVALVVNASVGRNAGAVSSSLGGILSGISAVPVVVLVFISKRLTSNVPVRQEPREGQMPAQPGLIKDAVLLGAILEGAALLSITAGLLGGPVFLILSALLIGWQVVHILRVADLVRRAAQRAETSEF